MVIDYPNDGHFGFDLGSITRDFKIADLWFNSQSHLDDFVAFIEAGNVAGNLTLQIQTSTTPSYWKFDGTNDIMPILRFKFRGVHKPYGGNSTIWIIEQGVFKQRAALSSSE